MNNLIKKIILIAFLLSSFLSFHLLSWENNKIEDMHPRHQKWLNEEVIYIITPKEKEVFLSLKSDNERDIFIEAFWKQRDPTAGTPENEYMEEHYKRILYANSHFGRETTRPGWMTDRGQIYIILGPPLDVDRYQGVKGVYPVEVWYYTGKEEAGLPPAFNIVFFKKRGMGEFKLYSPVGDGPYSLLINYRGDPVDFERAYMELRNRAPYLAESAVTLIPGETTFPGHASLISDVILSNIKAIPQKRINDDYAKALLKYKDIIEVEYTANYIQSDFLVKVYKEISGLFFVHYSIEPKELSISAFKDKYYSNFLVNGHFTDQEGNTIFQYEKNFYLEFNEQQLMNLEGKSLILEDTIPIIPGNYQFNLLVKNTVSKEFSSWEQFIDIQDEGNNLKMSSLLLGYKYEIENKSNNSIRPYKFGNFQFYTQPRSIFAKSDNLYIFFQIFGLSPDFLRKGFIRYAFMRDSSVYLKKDVPLSEYLQGINFKEEFPLSNFVPGYYILEVSVLDDQENVFLSESTQLEISPQPDISRPWVFSKAFPSSDNIEYKYILGTQNLNKGNFIQAEKLFGAAYYQVPTSLKYATAYSRVLMIQKNFDKVKNILLPFTHDDQVKDFTYMKILGQALQALREYEAAILQYKNYLSHVGTNLPILNSIGECYFLNSKTDEALIIWERSLEIDPNQKEIVEKVNAIKKISNHDKKNSARWTEF